MTFPLVGQTITVEFLVSGVWTDVTNLRPTYQCWLLSITGGSSSPGALVRRTKKSGVPVVTNSLEFTFQDKDAVLNNNNPYSPFYRQIPQGTNVRLTVNELIIIAALDAVEPDLNSAPQSATARVTCIGLWDLISLGDKPINSPIYRSTINAANLVEYWPMEEGSGADTFRSALIGGNPAALAGTASVSFAADSDLGGSKPVANMGSDSYVAFPMRAHSFSGHWQYDWFMRIHTQMPTDTVMRRMWTSSSAVAFWDIIFGDGTQRVRGYSNVGAVLVDSGLISLPSFVTPGWVHIRFMLSDLGGGTIKWQLVLFPVPIAAGSFISGTFSDTFGQLYYSQILQSANLQGVGYGHSAIYDAFDFSAVDSSGGGYTGERALTRFQRLATEEGISHTVSGTASDSMPMGPQRADTLTNLLVECAVTDGGIIFDTRSSLSIAMRTRADMYTQSASAMLSIGSSHLSRPLTPVTGGVSDPTIINDITVDRPNGGSARYVVPDDDLDHWTTQDPPDGVYDRDAKLTANASTDGALMGIAKWQTHIASWKEQRFSEIKIELARSALATDDALSAALRTIPPMNLIELTTTGASRWLPPGSARMLIESRTDKIAQFAHEITFVTRPADPYEVAQVNTSGSTLVAPTNSSATSMKFATSAGPEWSEADEPYHVQANGEAIKVTAIGKDVAAGIAAGTVAHADNASVTPGLPAGMTVDTGQVIIGFAAIRSSGTGTVNLPTGYTTLCNFGNILLFGKYYVTGDAAPTITFSGGAAGDTCSARLFGMSGTSLSLDGGRFGSASPSPQTNLSGSSDPIPYKALSVRRSRAIVLIAGWKQDDHTGVNAVAGFTEAFDSFTTTGNDQSIFLQYQVQGVTPTDIAAGSVTATGSVSAITRSIILALRPLQTATVTRGANGVTISHAVDEVVRGWRMGINGL